MAAALHRKTVRDLARVSDAKRDARARVAAHAKAGTARQGLRASLALLGVDVRKGRPRRVTVGGIRL